MPDTLPPSSFAPSPRTRVRRHPERAHYDRETVFAILDAALMCHIGYVIDGQPYVTPTLFWRDGERLYWHGSSASRMLRTQAQGIPVCLTVAHVDGLILGRCAFRHSLNYRAVMAFGTAAMVSDPAEKEAGLNAFIERVYPGRTGIMRGIAPQELKATALLGMTIEEASAKIRVGRPARPGRRLRGRLLGRDDPDRAAHGRGDPRCAGAAARRAGAGDRPFCPRRPVRRYIAGARPPGGPALRGQ